MPFAFSRDMVREEFSVFGEIVCCTIVYDRETGRSRGFGFVEYKDASSAKSAIESMDGKLLCGRHIVVREANDRTRRTHAKSSIWSSPEPEHRRSRSPGNRRSHGKNRQCN